MYQCTNYASISIESCVIFTLYRFSEKCNYNTRGSFHKAFLDIFYPKFEISTNFGIRYVSSLRCPNFSPNNRTQLMIELI